ncbi:hypothetical protein BLA6863_00380 [Burkholderia lata]|uniref:Uncharacterized protein n=1 Tax=Burkholderia lata (strain ATCC 17760 / DSM 23089 / LMG 22485 / NCIMB 9086 / R18194 / 383) TaxID=482957 RepID=A0A6P2H6Q7_BURL3|nr:hypothetical protein BLA6863_00380 [Burkholderia lata]
MADGWLTFVQPHCGPCYMTLRQQGMQGKQQVEVDSAELIHSQIQ